MLSFASKASSLSGALSNFGPLGGVIDNLVNNDIYANVPTKDLKLSQMTINNILKNDHTVTDFGGYLNTNVKTRILPKNSKGVYFEDPNKFDIYALRTMNMYRFKYESSVRSLFDSIKESDKSMKVKFTETGISPSLFNPSYGVQTIGIMGGVPLLNDYQDDNWVNFDRFDCSIRRLVADSMNVNSPLGTATYRLVDFMFCKDLGKVPNNRLITLRKYPLPIGDHITRFATPKYAADVYTYDTPGDIGRLVSWFDTDDNKLEDICKYDMKMSWKEITSKIQEIDSKEENSEQRGILGAMINTINPRYNSFNDSMGGMNHNLIAMLGSKLNIRPIPASDNNDILRMSADNNKVYTPKNTVQDTHLYEGKLTLNQELTLNFSYKLRAYENINPKSAFLDLMGNILAVTYKRGTYWAGSRRMIGPPQNTSAWSKATAFIDNAWHKLGGFVEAMAAGTVDFDSILGAVSNVMGYANKLVNQTKEMAEEFVGGSRADIAQNAAQGLKKLDSKTGISKYLKGYLKDQLGRPALYAADSLINGDNCGFWHLTIGNPYNPIMTIGNLIMTNSTVQHFGPLGVDDFPSEIKVTVTVKPGRSRDASEIARYYTNGLNNIYYSKVGQSIDTFHNFTTVDENGKKVPFTSAHEEKFRAESEKSKKTVQENDDLDKSVDSDLQKNKIVDSYRNYDLQYSDDNSSMYIKEIESGLIHTTNNYNPLYYLRAHDEEDYA